MPGHELTVISDRGTYEGAREAASELSVGQMHLAAEQAGFNEWLAMANSYALNNLGAETSEALRMPFPSPFTQAWRAEAGYTGGVATDDKSAWSLGIGDDIPTEEFDTGVRLVCVKNTPDKTSLRFPLDIVVPIYAYRQTITGERPDKIVVHIGDRQLPSYSSFSAEQAQRLLIVGARFMNLLASGEAASLQRVIEPPQRGLKRMLGRSRS